MGGKKKIGIKERDTDEGEGLGGRRETGMKERDWDEGERLGCQKLCTGR